MCGIACYIGTSKEDGYNFGMRSKILLRHRGPDDEGIYNDEQVTLAQTRLSILDLTESGHQPMASSCGRYMLAYNGEIYNHLELRKKYLAGHHFKGHSDTETIIELFRLQKEKMQHHLVGMWSIIIWDKEAKRTFISRSRFGQKPFYVRRTKQSWLLSSEIKPLLSENENPVYDPTAIAEYLALGNYAHLGAHTFYNDIQQFPEGSYAWLSSSDDRINPVSYWELPDIADKDKVPFDKSVQKELHDRIVDSVLSETISDVPIGITLSGGIDSSIIAGILATYYDKGIHIFTAQSVNGRFDETRYVDAVVRKFGKDTFIVHQQSSDEISIKKDLTKYIKIQEEPFGDSSIIAHGNLMEMAAQAGIKVILNGQGADELFFGYSNMARAILSEQLKEMQLKRFSSNLSAMKMGNGYFMRTMLESILPTIEYNMRLKSRIKRRSIIKPGMLHNVDNDLISLFKYNSVYNVWRESMYGVHIPHLVHYDDRNAMAYSIEGRMPFLDHRIAEYVATIRPTEFLKNGMRKYILRESCKQYLPDIVYNRTDKIGFYTPLTDLLNKDAGWVSEQLNDSELLNKDTISKFTGMLANKSIAVSDALQVWRCISVHLWMKEYNIK